MLDELSSLEITIMVSQTSETLQWHTNAYIGELINCGLNVAVLSELEDDSSKKRRAMNSWLVQQQPQARDIRPVSKLTSVRSNSL